MAQGDVTVYNGFWTALAGGEHDLSSDTVKAMLVSGHTLDKDNDDLKADIVADEVSGTGYTAGGVAVAVTLTQDDTNDRLVVDVADAAWTGLDVGTPSHVIFYNDTHASDALICVMESGKASNGGDYTAEINASGLFYIQN